MGIHSGISRTTLAKANERRDWRIYADFTQSLIPVARKLYVDEDLGLDLDNTIYTLDSTTIDLCLSVFPWAHFRTAKAAIKLHTLLDLRGNIPTFIHISDGNLHDVNVLDILIPEPGSFYVMERGYVDFGRLFELNQCMAFFVTRAKSNLQFRRLYSHPVDKTTGLRCDQTIVLTGFYSRKDYPAKLRRIKYRDAETGKVFVFLTNNFSLPALTIAKLYRHRWKVELFFKWIKQHLFWHHRQCSQNSGVDRSVRICTGSHHQKEAQPGCQPLHNSTNFECHHLRKNGVISGTYRSGHQNGELRYA
jgi:hypothetical protein